MFAAKFGSDSDGLPGSSSVDILWRGKRSIMWSKLVLSALVGPCIISYDHSVIKGILQEYLHNVFVVAP